MCQLGKKFISIPKNTIHVLYLNLVAFTQNNIVNTFLMAEVVLNLIRDVQMDLKMQGSYLLVEFLS